MTITVITPTYNGAHKIMTALHALEQQRRKPDEVIVVIDGSTDRTEELLRDSQFSLPLSVINQENKGRACVRNRGAEEAKSELLVFLDDDMKAGPDWLGVHEAHHKRFPGTILTSIAIDPVDKNSSDFQLFKSGISNKWAGEIKAYDGKEIPADKVFITAANFSLPRTLFLALGGFNVMLNDGEDYDLAIRAARKNVPVYYDSKAFGWHLEQTTCAHTIRRSRNYYNAGKMLLEANPEIYEPLFGHRREQSKSFKSKLFKLFCNRFWIESIDAGQWTWLPKKLRFKLYDIVLTANATLFPDIVKL